jgi:hypothetical protein
MTLDEAARHASQTAEGLIAGLRALSDLGQVLAGKPTPGRGLSAGFTLVAPPANLAEIIRSAEVHRTFIVRALNAPGSPLPGPPHPEIAKAIHEALFHPRTFRQVAAPGMPIPANPALQAIDRDLRQALFDALFHPRTFRALNAPGSPLPRTP